MDMEAVRGMASSRTKHGVKTNTERIQLEQELFSWIDSQLARNPSWQNQSDAMIQKLMAMPDSQLEAMIQSIRTSGTSAELVALFPPS